MSCPDRNLAVFHHYRHYEGLRLLPSVCDSKLIQQTLIINNSTFANGEVKEFKEVREVKAKFSTKKAVGYNF